MSNLLDTPNKAARYRSGVSIRDDLLLIKVIVSF